MLLPKTYFLSEPSPKANTQSRNGIFMASGRPFFLIRMFSIRVNTLQFFHKRDLLILDVTITSRPFLGIAGKNCQNYPHRGAF